MKYSFFKSDKFIIKVILFIFISIYINPFLITKTKAAEFSNKEEVEKAINLIFENRNKALINGNADLIKAIFDTKTKYGTWAFEHEKKKMQYIHNWQEKQGIKFTNITHQIVIKRIREKANNSYSVNLLCSTEYKYKYDNQTDKENSSRIGTYHVLNIENRGSEWIITKEWYKDPFADSLYLDNTKAYSSKEYILLQNEKDVSALGERRLKAMEYADQFCGAASEKKYGFKYNNKYRDYNPKGGDCANFASQILFEGGKFKKNGAWNYDRAGATRAWLNADGFKNYMINSGRASLIAHGSYDKVYKASYKLLPGDFVAYEKKGDITHISTVTGSDSRGYALVSCHNTDRNKVPWDLGWSDKNIKFWLVHVNY
jgi:hypothetical protein